MKRSLSQATFLALLTAGVAALVACSAETTTLTSSSTPDAGGSPASEETSAPSGGDAGRASTKADSGTSAPPASSTVTLSIGDASYTSSTAAGGGFVHSLEIALNNDSEDDVTSLDTMEIDFGGGNVVALTKPVCGGAFPIAAGKSKLVEMQIVVSNGGSLSNFAFICPGKQTFGGASGKAPPSASFEGEVAVTLGGKTKGGSFTASGTATRSN